jgi:hypothetical protein
MILGFLEKTSANSESFISHVPSYHLEEDAWKTGLLAVMGLCQTQKETVLSKKAVLVMPQE